MAELILPLNRTMFLPPGSPGIGCITGISGDLRDVRCGAAEGEVYCLGEADILINYTSWSHRSLFSTGLPTDQGGQQEWQALLTLGFQLSTDGQLPESYRVNLGKINWSLVAARAVELETCIIISYEQQYARQENTDKGGAWRMVNIDQLDENQQIAATQAADEATSFARQVEVIGLGDSESDDDLRQTIVRALQEADAVAQACRKVWEGPEELGGSTEQYTISTVFPNIQPGMAEAVEPEADDIEAVLEAEIAAMEAEIVSMEAEAVAAPAQQLNVVELAEPVEAEEVMAQPVDELAEQLAEISVEMQALEQELSTVEAEPVAVEVLPEAEPVLSATRKRGFRGFPGLHVEAHNNDIDVTAFKINIKL